MIVQTAPPLDPVAYYAKTRPHKIACCELETGFALSYAALDARISRMAATLESAAAPAKLAGARVASLARNSLDLVCLYVACVRTGAIYAPLNWRLSGGEVALIAADVEPAIVMHDAEFESAASSIASSAEAVFLRTGRDLEAALDAAEMKNRSHHGRGLHDLTTLLCTSGTTGKPKAVMVTEANALAMARNYSCAAEVGPNAVFLCNMPMFHVVGLFAVTRTVLQVGGTLLVSSRFDPDDTIAEIADPRWRVTHYFCAPQMAQMLRQARTFDSAPFAKLTALQTGGAPHAASAIREWVKGGVRLIDGFGMSEAGTVLGMPPGDLDLIWRKAGSAGLPAIEMEVRLVTAEGRDVSDGETGEIWLRGPAVTPGYWRNEAATRAAFDDGWFKTGDAARRDEDGFYTIVDRWKDMYISGGENVYPAEVEAVLSELAGVADVAVVGVADQKWGETGVAFVVRRADARLTPEDVTAFCRTRLAAYKAPRHIQFVDALPRTASGKLKKAELRQSWETRLEHSS